MSLQPAAACVGLVLLCRVGSRGNGDWLRRLDNGGRKTTACGDGAWPLSASGDAAPGGKGGQAPWRQRFSRCQTNLRHGASPHFPPTLRSSTRSFHIAPIRPQRFGTAAAEATSPHMARDGCTIRPSAKTLSQPIPYIPSENAYSLDSGAGALVSDRSQGLRPGY